MPYTNAEIRGKYEAFAGRFDLVAGLPLKLLGVDRLRRRLLERSRGRVLEIAAGTGANLGLYPPGTSLVVTDLARAMLSVAERKAARLDLSPCFLEASADGLPFPAASFDTVVSTLSLCTFPDPEGVLRELARVCSPAGRILMLEHGRSEVRWIARLQDRYAELHARALGCYWNREPDRIVEASGLKVLDQHRALAGVFHSLEVAPS